MEGFLRNEADCKHDEGFVLLSWSGGDRYAWFCRLECGYYMFFDPEKYPSGVAYMDRKDGKTLPEFVTSKY